LKFLIKQQEISLNNSEKLFQKGQIKIYEELNILKKLQDIDKIKSVLFNEELLYFFINLNVENSTEDERKT